MIVISSALPAVAANLEILTAPSKAPDCITLAERGGNRSVILVDTNDFAVVQVAANLFADDVRRVTGARPVVTNSSAGASQMVVVGTLGHNALIDSLADAGKLKDLNAIKDRWEATLWQIVEKPFPGVERALVIVGSDRRGAAYGLMQLSEKIGVSPWHWWADVPAKHHDALAIKISSPQTDAPEVKYRGIFINDEDWGLNPWASKTFDPKFGNIGPKTYEKVFELLLRLRLNYIWPAMHACSVEFASAPENIALADKYGIVAGSSHCEPMLCNNVHWNEKKQGRWNYLLNSNAIHSYWEENVKMRDQDEAVWTIGIRGIHDSSMEKPPADIPARIRLMENVFGDQRELLNQYVTKQWGPVAQCFVPYKEVLQIYDAGLKVPEDATLVWVDDNFGYIRRLSNPAERRRPGGAGVYWHVSYYGGPHSYTWIDTTAPALMWEELHKAWENDARKLWVINVGDIKPAEIGIDYYSRLAWNPEAFPLGSQREFLQNFAARN
ncbi:MAG TPA: glycosyl hydrolase 115 family protein, partial [Verrucomicrobiae bacterium]|nr:glycosyl hydrolase 115 family protein [Verrucomicrobiae bacterium]